MKINVNLQKFQQKTQNQKYNSNPFRNTQQMGDSVSFSGKFSKPAVATKIFKGIKEWAGIGALIGLALSAKDNKTEIKAPVLEANAASYQNTVTTPWTTNATTAPTVAGATINADSTQNITFQLKQTKDSPSLTFDFTDNYKAWEIKPIGTSVILTSKPERGSIDQFKNLNDVITDIYEIDEQDTEIRRTVAQAVLKANPEMTEIIGANLGDVTNIDLDTILNTNYAKSGNLRISLPTVVMTAERRNDYDTEIMLNTEFLPKNANKNGEAVITLNAKDFNAWSDEANDKILGRKLANAYGISTFNSYAGDAIWHGIALDEANYEIFAGASEEKTKTAFYNYIKENGTVELTLPRVGVTVMTSEAQDVANNILTQEKTLDVTISYMSPVSPVFDLQGKTTFRPIDVLGTIPFTDGTTIKEAYEENSDKYVSLALAAWQQQVDNNNILIEHYGAKTLNEEDLYSEIDLKKLGATDMKINLQPIAIAHPDCPLTCAPIKNSPIKEEPQETTRPTETEETTRPTETEDTEPTETDPTETDPTETDPTETDPTETDPTETDPTETDPTETDPTETDPTETDPTETDPTTEPTTEPTEETECPTLPTVNPEEDELDPTRPSKPTNPTEPSEDTQPTETQPCPTEPSIPKDDDEEKDGEDYGSDFEDETEPTKPVSTQPTETQPCPTEPSIPKDDDDDKGGEDYGSDFEDEPTPTKPAETQPAPTKPVETQPTPTKPAETQPAPTQPSQGSNDNTNVKDDETGFDEPQATTPAPTPTQPAPAPTQPAPAPTQPAPAPSVTECPPSFDIPDSSDNNNELEDDFVDFE